jgi:hypothetical protein
MLAHVTETQIDLSQIRCPRCASELVLRICADESAGAVQLSIDTACVSCGVAPWAESDQRLLVFRPGAPIGAALSGAASDYAAELAAAQGRVDALVGRCEALEREVAAARSAAPGVDERDLMRSPGVAINPALDPRRRKELEQELRGEIARLELALSSARAEVRRADEATRSAVSPGQRAIELD